MHHLVRRYHILAPSNLTMSELYIHHTLTILLMETRQPQLFLKQRLALYARQLIVVP